MKRDHTMDTAIDKIYKHYGGNVDLPVNKILLKLRADRKAKAAPFFDHLAQLVKLMYVHAKKKMYTYAYIVNQLHVSLLLLY